MTDRLAFPNREEALNLLAKRLHWKMEHLDPSENSCWDALGDRDRAFYHLCIEAIFNERELSRAALK